MTTEAEELAGVLSFPRKNSIKLLDGRMSVRNTLYMKRTTIWLAESQIAKLNKLSKSTGIKMAELVRRFVDKGLSKQK